MRKSTSKFIKEHRGESYTCKSRTLEFTNMVTGEKIPGPIAEELDRLKKFDKTLSKGWVLIFTIR